ncbi:PLP-dependent aminotransferase family protein [Dysgonomonas sp. HGC4]|uniref:MocR-like pyridoxine biosynthesis transcription factor PdxR n=1 Tax=Dysgonomonas sp. HGC4 TaxID=1658009 RepID=UPI000680F094|nr:PLP-dependent aminotransferase family protein [Dysgonomonas sp. HGC4]MBD8346737.1 PLP-dependent aminotransferase family protein [Dysgonomonas sp. HGC4]
MLRPWTFQIQFERDSKKAIYLQITDYIIDLIKNGTLKSGDTLPSSRLLALDLGINRNTVIKALDILISEGWLYSEERKGLFVSANLPAKERSRYKKDIQKSILQNQEKESVIIFDSGLPDTQIAPMRELASAYRQIFNRKARINPMLNRSEFGALRFRESVSRMLNQTRGMHTDYSEICITRGSQMALFLIAHALLNKGDLILVENPGYGPAWETFRHAGAELIPISVDEKGIDVEEIERTASTQQIKAVYITPHHQYPTTVIMSLDRRLRLIELSNLYGFTIIEDDYDCDFHFGLRPIAPLSSLDGANDTIYIGTFSKMISESLRVGYLVANNDIIQKVGNLRRIIDLQGDNIMEQAILELIESGVIKKHIRKASKYYLHKRNYFISLISKYLSDKVTYKEPEGGLAFWLKLRNKQDINKLNQALKLRGVSIIPWTNYSFDNKIDGIRLGYASLSESQLEKGIEILSKVIR